MLSNVIYTKTELLWKKCTNTQYLLEKIGLTLKNVT